MLVRAAAASDSQRVAFEERARAALTAGDLKRLLDLSDEARRWPPGEGSGLSEALAAIGDLRDGDVSGAVTRLVSVGPLAVIVLTLVFLAATLVLGALIYLPFAVIAWTAGARRVAIELPKSLTGPGLGRRVSSHGAPTAWRTPLGLGSGLILTLADDTFGMVAALAIAWLGFGAPGAVFAIDDLEHAGVLAALGGTAAGNIGALALAFLLYRSRGAGAAAAGLVPIPFGRLLGVGAAVAVPLFLLSIAHDMGFIALMGREPQSNMGPILDSLIAPGSSPLVVLALIVTVILIAPLVEEVIYRGVIYRAFRDRAGVPLAIVASGLIFAITHVEIDHLLPLWWIGMALAWVAERTGSILPAIAVHMFYNGLSLGIYLLDRAG
jgi:membrane protease YdiL (CAAX protease family)